MTRVGETLDLTYDLSHNFQAMKQNMVEHVFKNNNAKRAILQCLSSLTAEEAAVLLGPLFWSFPGLGGYLWQLFAWEERGSQLYTESQIALGQNPSTLVNIQFIR